MVLYLIGLGLFDEKDVTIRGFECIKQSDKIYLESYTSILLTNVSNLEIIISDRKSVEECSDEMIEEAKTQMISFLVVGDPFCATTHTDLALRAIEAGVDVKVIHNASILNAVGACGLQLYTFGETISIPFFDKNWRPHSFYDKIVKNMSMGLHTLCLLDIKVKEQTLENLMKGKEIYEAPRYMTINQAISQIFEVEEIYKQNNICCPNTKAFGIARLGSETDQQIISGSLEELQLVDFGPPLHSLVICAPTLHEVEERFYQVRRRK